MAATGRFGLSGTQYDNRLAVGSNDIADERVGGLDLEALRAPPELLAGGRVPATDQVDPKGVVDLGSQLMGEDWDAGCSGCVGHGSKRPGNPAGHDRVLDERVGGDGVDGLVALVFRQGGEGPPDEVEDRRGILSPAINLPSIIYVV